MKKVLLFTKKKWAVALFFLLALPIVVKAGGLVPCSGPDCKLCHLFVMFDNIVNFIFLKVVPPIAVLMLIIGGIMFYVSIGEPEKITKAKRLIMSTIAGILIVYFAWGIVIAIFTALGATEWVDGWYNIRCP